MTMAATSAAAATPNSTFAIAACDCAFFSIATSSDSKVASRAAVSSDLACTPK